MKYMSFIDPNTKFSTFFVRKKKFQYKYMKLPKMLFNIYNIIVHDLMLCSSDLQFEIIV